MLNAALNDFKQSNTIPFKQNVEKNDIFLDNDNNLITGVFNVNVDKQKKFVERINLKDFNITNIPSKSEIAENKKTHSFDNDIIKKIFLAKITPTHTNEYIKIKRKEYISTIIKRLNEMKLALNDKVSLLISLSIFKNELKSIYRFFLESNQDEHFISIINLIEETLKNNIDKKIIKECHSALENIKDKNVIEYKDYENFVRKFFNMGIDVINLKELNEGV